MYLLTHARSLEMPDSQVGGRNRFVEEGHSRDLTGRIVDAFGPEHIMWEGDSGGPVVMQDPHNNGAVAPSNTNQAHLLHASFLRHHQRNQ